MVLAFLPYYVEAILQAEHEGRWVSILTATAIGSMLLSVPLFGRLAQRRSKRWAFRLAMLGSALVFPLLAIAGFLPGVQRELQAILAFLIAGIPMAGVYLFPATLTADIVDDEAVRAGTRREATYYGTQNFVEKSVGALAPFLLLLLLTLGKSAADPLGIRLVGPVAGLIVFAGFLAFRGYSLADTTETPVLQPVRMP
jgi:Na+/melibiose symporter-like transporter